MKRIALFLVLAAFAHTAANCQISYGITEFPNFPTDSSIVRDVDDDHTLIYSHNKSTLQGSFILYEHTTGNAQYFNIPKKLQVMDMEINGAYVYFCGNEGSNHAFVGQFDIMGCFAGSAPFYYCIIPTATPYMVEMNTATRMTTMEWGGMVYILGIGDATHNYTEPVPYTASTLFSAFMVSGNWNFSVDYQINESDHRESHGYDFNPPIVPEILTLEPRVPCK